MWSVLVGDVAVVPFSVSCSFFFNSNLVRTPAEIGGWGLGWGADRVWKMNWAFWGRAGRGFWSPLRVHCDCCRCVGAVGFNNWAGRRCHG